VLAVQVPLSPALADVATRASKAARIQIRFIVILLEARGLRICAACVSARSDPVMGTPYRRTP
jgi:hypothetical protein